MITVTMEYPLKPGMLEQFGKAIDAALKDTAKRPGFRWVKVIRPCEGDEKVLLLEEWDSAEDYMAYLAWRADGNSPAGLAECAAGRPTFTLWSDVIASA